MDPQARLLELLREEASERKYNSLSYMYPSEGEFSRDKYPKHMELIKASSQYHELGMLGGNGVAKSTLGAVFTAILSTGRYPEWWDGYHVNRPVRWWVAGITKTEVRTSTQKYLLGDVAEKGDEYLGTGYIPKEDIVDIRYIPNSNKACDFVTVRNRAGPGGLSIIRFKSYDQGADTFQADNLDGAWEDEEPPTKIHAEIMQRFRAETREGRVLTTCTPLEGRTEFINKMLDWREANAKDGASRFTVIVGQREVPHLTEEEINRRLASAPANQRKARETGMPYVGAGQIYTVEEDAFVIPPFRIPSHFKRVFGFDGGWHNTAIAWIAYDADTDTVYVYKDYKRGEQPIPVHASAIKDQGVWIPGIGDVYATNQDDGQKIQKLYQEQGVRIRKADKSVEAGIQAILTRLETGRLKVFSTCGLWLEEYRDYRRELKETDVGERSIIVKKNDHLMDATRYVIYAGLKYATNQRAELPMPTGEIRFGT